MNVRLMRSAIAGLALLTWFGAAASGRAAECERPESKQPPNLILIVCDNLGYGDVGCFGSTRNKTPHLDRMAAEGMRLTSFYATSGVCTPSRASIVTGCYPRRVNMHWSPDGGHVLRPVGMQGLHPDEITIADALKNRGYATAIIGKWHLGDQPEFLPTRQGFDYYFGIPYSDDMTPRPGKPWPPLPLMENEKVIEAPVDRSQLTKRYTKRAIEFITEHRDEPFFIYLPHATPGSTKSPFVAEEFLGRSGNGNYGDSVEEIDWSTGEILQTLKRLELDDETLVVWTSDNGAVNRRHSSNRPLKGWGYTTSEGGMRVPCIVRWPGRVPAGTTCDELCTTMDLLPTFARLAGGHPPQDRIIDGHDIRPLLFGLAGAKSPYDAFFYYYAKQLQAVRSGKWKLYLALDAKWKNLRGATAPSAAELYDLEADLGETKNLAAERPDVVERLLQYAEHARADLGDGEQEGQNQRPAGLVENPQPQVLSEAR